MINSISSNVLVPLSSSKKTVPCIDTDGYCINAEGKPSPVKFVINYNNQFSEPQFIAFFQDWDLSPSFKAKNFIF